MTKVQAEKTRNTFYAKTRKAWRNWLIKNHETQNHIWLLIYKKSSPTKSIQYDEAVEEALCFGWIDSIVKKNDNDSRLQYFSPRKPKSNWSKLNRERAEKMIAEKLMAPAGQAMIDLAKKTGTWEALTDVKNSVIPDDLLQQLEKNKNCIQKFSGISTFIKTSYPGMDFKYKKARNP